MLRLKAFLLISIFFLTFSNSTAQNKIVTVGHFEKVIISPHIQVRFVKGDKETVKIESNKVSEDKLNIEFSGKTLRIYLDGAKTTTKSEKVKDEHYKGKQSIYKGTIVKATVTYKTLKALSLRGEQKFVCESTLELDKFDLDIYGESQVYLNDVKLNSITTTVYGESILEIKSGTIGHQKIVSYGESEINTLNVSCKTAKITAYGEGTISLKVEETLKVTSYGEATIQYKGNPTINKGIVIGETEIQKID
jgi:hypothetical protein